MLRHFHRGTEEIKEEGESICLIINDRLQEINDRNIIHMDDSRGLESAFRPSHANDDISKKDLKGAG